MKKLALALGILGVFCTGLSATASVHVWNEFTTGALNILSDDSREALINLVDPVGAPTTQIDVGDQFVGIFQINSFKAPTVKNFGIDWINEFTGVFQLDVTGKALTGNTIALPGGGVAPEYSFTFAPTGTVAGANPLGIAGWAAGTMLATWSDAANDFSTSGGFAADVTSASGGMPAWQFGFTGAAGEGWDAAAVDDLALYAAASPTWPLGQFKFSVNKTNAFMPGTFFMGETSFFDAAFTVDMNGSGGLQIPTGGGWPVMDNIDLTFSPIPEPASVLLLGELLGLAVGLGIVRRRKRTK